MNLAVSLQRTLESVHKSVSKVCIAMCKQLFNNPHHCIIIRVVRGCREHYALERYEF